MRSLPRAAGSAARFPPAAPATWRCRAEAAAQVANRGVKAVAARENVYLATDQPRDEAHYDAETRTFHPARKPAREPGKPDTRDRQFNERMLTDLAAAVGTPAERKAAEAGHALEVARLAGVQVPGRNPAPDGLSAAQEKARTSMVGDLAARTALERLGIQYAPALPSEQARKDQAAYAGTPGALDQAWREAASVRAHLVSRDWGHERKPEMLEHSAGSTFESPVRAREAKAQERGGPQQAAHAAPQAGPEAGAPASGGDRAVEPPR